MHTMLNDNAWKHRRVPVPKRTIELIALIAISSTLFLFLHTRELHSRLRKMEVRLQPGEDEMLSANQLSSGHKRRLDEASNLVYPER